MECLLRQIRRSPRRRFVSSQGATRFTKSQVCLCTDSLSPAASTSLQSSGMARPFSRAVLAQGGPRCEEEYLFFYGHGKSAGSHAVLSNWYVLERPFKDQYGNAFPTSEHFMMFAKARLFNDDDMATRILSCSSALEAKRLGRKVRGFDAKTWNERCIDLVADGCVLKFSQCSICRDVLLSTDQRILVEAAPRDRVWGIGMGAKNPARLDAGTWRGENRLGEALMIVRGRLREAQSNCPVASPKQEAQSSCPAASPKRQTENTCPAASPKSKRVRK
jgi:ribA/ribD-fused uncharacterized protein